MSISRILNSKRKKIQHKGNHERSIFFQRFFLFVLKERIKDSSLLSIFIYLFIITEEREKEREKEQEREQEREQEKKGKSRSCE